MGQHKFYIYSYHYLIFHDILCTALFMSIIDNLTILRQTINEEIYYVTRFSFNYNAYYTISRKEYNYHMFYGY